MRDTNIKKENEKKEYEILKDLNKKLTDFSKAKGEEKDDGDER